jgi:hypothetical protein
MGILSWLFGEAPATPALVANIKNGPGLFKINVVGESHYQKNLEAICGGKDEDSKCMVVEATLVLDNENKFDENAVAVFIQGSLVGYLDRETAKSFRYQLQQVERDQEITSACCSAMIVGGWYRGPEDEGSFGVKLDLPTSEEE